jgi:hypothetical protein
MGKRNKPPHDSGGYEGNLGHSHHDYNYFDSRSHSGSSPSSRPPVDLRDLLNKKPAAPRELSDTERQIAKEDRDHHDEADPIKRRFVDDMRHMDNASNTLRVCTETHAATAEALRLATAANANATTSLEHAQSGYNDCEVRLAASKIKVDAVDAKHKVLTDAREATEAELRELARIFEADTARETAERAAKDDARNKAHVEALLAITNPALKREPNPSPPIYDTANNIFLRAG